MTDKRMNIEHWLCVTDQGETK